MRYEVGCTLDYQVEVPVDAVFNIRPSVLAQQKVLAESLTLSMPVGITTQTELLSGNRLDRCRLMPGECGIEYRATVEVNPHATAQDTVDETALADLPVEVLRYLAPSRYCEADRLAAFAQKTFEGFTGHTRVTAIANWIYDHIAYRTGSSNSHTTAIDTLTDREGVCRDFSHVGIAVCRALGIPARFVSVYAHGLQPPDFHAVFEAYLDRRWYLFDATRKADPRGFVRVGCGRDAADAAFATFWGGRVDPEHMEVWIKPIDDASDEASGHVEAVSLAAE